jgi:hypothetical protein
VADVEQGLRTEDLVAVAAVPFVGRVNTSHPMSKPDAGFQALVNMPCLIDDPLDAAT